MMIKMNEYKITTRCSIREAGKKNAADTGLVRSSFPEVAQSLMDAGQNTTGADSLLRTSKQTRGLNESVSLAQGSQANNNTTGTARDNEENNLLMEPLVNTVETNTKAYEAAQNNVEQICRAYERQAQNLRELWPSYKPECSTFFENQGGQALEVGAAGNKQIDAGLFPKSPEERYYGPQY